MLNFKQAVQASCLLLFSGGASYEINNSFSVKALFFLSNCNKVFTETQAAANSLRIGKI